MTKINCKIHRNHSIMKISIFLNTKCPLGGTFQNDNKIGKSSTHRHINTLNTVFCFLTVILSVILGVTFS